MTISRHRIKKEASVRPHRAAGGFSLTELIIAATLSLFVMSAVLSAFLFIGRTGYRASSYSTMETELRRGLEIFAGDVRAASKVRWNSTQSITLTVPGVTPLLYTYAYDNEPGSPTFRCFYRKPGDTSSTQSRQVLIHSVASDFSFQRYKLEQDGVADNTAHNDLETKQLQVVLHTVGNMPGVPAATQKIASARYILRNKQVSN